MSSLLRRLPLFLLIAAFACGLGAVRASAAVVASAGPTFTAATTGRTWMDQGNVWGNSAIAANGDQFSITLQNNGATQVTGIVLTVALPAGFTRIGTASPFVTGTTTTLTFASQTINAGSTVTYTFGLSAGASVVAGTYAINYSWTGGGTASVNVLVTAGAYVTESTPAKLTLQVNASGIYTYKITNTGLGGLFNVVFDEAGNTAPSNAWTFNSFGTTVKIVLKQFAPVSAPLGVSNTVTITATFTALNGATTVFTTPLTHKDITITGVNGSAALDLVKTVNVDTALPGAPIIYTITYTNKAPTRSRPSRSMTRFPPTPSS